MPAASQKKSSRISRCLGGADVRVTLEIDARVPNGAPESVVQIVTENCRTLTFASQGFEKE
jgi:hypothetical protein